jgi:hypothetical protein
MPQHRASDPFDGKDVSIIRAFFLKRTGMMINHPSRRPADSSGSLADLGPGVIGY